MKIIIVSDTHDNLPNFKKAVDWAEKNKIQRLIHCGDVCSPDLLEKALENFSGEFFLCLGNADDGYGWENAKNQKKFLNGEIFKDFGEIQLEKKRIAFCHFPEQAKILGKSKNYDMIFYGHTHRPWFEKIGTCKLINPGTLAGIGYKPSFAVYDTSTDKLELKILENLHNLKI